MQKAGLNNNGFYFMSTVHFQKKTINYMYIPWLPWPVFHVQVKTMDYFLRLILWTTYAYSVVGIAHARYVDLCTMLSPLRMRDMLTFALISGGVVDQNKRHCL